MSDLKIETIEHVTVVYLSGNLNALTVRQLEPQISCLIHSDGRLILHMAEVEFISSLGLWMLFSLQREMKDRDGRLILVQTPEVVQDTLSVVGFSSVLHTFPSLEAGLDFLHSPKDQITT